MFLLRYLVRSLGLFKCLGTLKNWRFVFAVMLLSKTANGETTLVGSYFFTETNPDQYVTISLDLQEGVAHFYSNGTNWYGVSSRGDVYFGSATFSINGNKSIGLEDAEGPHLLHVHQGGIVAARISYTVSGGIVTDYQQTFPEPPLEWHSYSETLQNDGTEPIIFEIGIFDEEGNLIDSKEYWMDPGDMLDLDLAYGEAFQVKARELTEDNGWEHPATWGDAYDSSSATTGSEVPQFGQWSRVTDQWLTQEGYNPTLPYDPAIGQDGQQIINAIETAIGDNRQQVENLKALETYFHNSSNRTRQEMLGQLSQLQNNIIGAINSIPTDQYGDDFLAVQNSLAIINAAQTNLDSAINNLAYDVTGVIDDRIAGVTGEIADQTNDIANAIDAAIANQEQPDFSEIGALASSVQGLAQAVADRPTVGDLDQDILNQVTAINSNTNQANATLAQIKGAADGIQTAIENQTSPPDYSGVLGQIKGNTEATQLALYDEEGVSFLSAIKEALAPDVETVGQIIDEKIQQATDVAIAAGNTASAEMAAKIPQVQVQSNLSPSGSQWPTADIPIIGTIRFDPWFHFPWLVSVASWSLNLLKWASSIAFMTWFLKQLEEAVSNASITPVQATSGGGATGFLAPVIKRLGIAALFVAVCIGLIVGIATAMKAPVIDVINLAGAFMDITSGAPAMAAFGISEMAKFVPISHIIFLAGLAIVVKQIQIPAVTSVQVVIRLFTV
jgi:hypothetical protein